MRIEFDSISCVVLVEIDRVGMINTCGESRLNTISDPSKHHPSNIMISHRLTIYSSLLHFILPTSSPARPDPIHRFHHPAPSTALNTPSPPSGVSSPAVHPTPRYTHVTLHVTRFYLPSAIIISYHGPTITSAHSPRSAVGI